MSKRGRNKVPRKLRNEKGRLDWADTLLGLLGSPQVPLGPPRTSHRLHETVQRDAPCDSTFSTL